MYDGGFVMDTYNPPYQITDQMITLISSISEKLGSLTARHNFERKLHLRRNNKIRSIHSSLKIEANSLSLGEVRDVIEGKAVLGPQKEIQEVKNAFEAYTELATLNPYDINELKRMHGIMTKYIVNDAGSFRLGEEGVFQGDRCIFMAPPARFVPELVQSLFDWMNRSKSTVHPLILSSIFHYEFVFIHPFSDGNGRIARLWHSALLTKWNPLFEYIPIESQIEKFQDGYYQAIADCHVDGSSTKFILFILQRIDEILAVVGVQSKTSEENSSQYVKRLLAVMEYDIPYTAGELLSMLELKSKESLRRHYLTPAIQQGLLKMTLPDKPKSKNQRYVKP